MAMLIILHITNLTISQMSLTYQWKMRSRESSELIQYPRRLRQRNAEDSRNHQQASWKLKKGKWKRSSRRDAKRTLCEGPSRLCRLQVGTGRSSVTKTEAPLIELGMCASVSKPQNRKVSNSRTHTHTFSVTSLCVALSFRETIGCSLQHFPRSKIH